MSERTGATDQTRILALTDRQLARVMNGLVAAYSPADGEWHDDLAALAFTTCLDAMRGKPADAVVVTPEIAATAEDACEYASAVLRERADKVDWLPDTNVQGMRDRSARYRAAAAALRGEGI